MRVLGAGKLIGVVVSAIVVLGFSALKTDAAEYKGWFRCPTNGIPSFELQVRSKKVRCWARGGYYYAPPNKCLPGQTYKQNYNGKRDKCVTGIGPAALSFDPSCPPGHALRVESGKDRCRKYYRARSISPGVKTP